MNNNRRKTDILAKIEIRRIERYLGNFYFHTLSSYHISAREFRKTSHIGYEQFLNLKGAPYRPSTPTIAS